MDYQAINNEIANDPQSLGYSAYVTDKNDLAIAELLNSSTVDVVGWVSRNDFLIWAAQSIRGVIEDTASAQSDPLRSSALVLQSICNGATDGIDFTKAQNVALLDSWVSASKITETDKNSLLALATKPIERSVYLFGRRVTHQDISKALRG
ncbi:hypothetical protein [Nitrosomonas marina]|uniref:Uncharacterized protein n=1 Tax=Nitrosomonas marina TaxID=917 RepID=A0A1H8IQS6_9PROT|nr:hypothetical protein [Nitrosomonas marina]SEN71260.1 hypothetical protein SAMN05216325_13913 [Nitrosomonas marina]